jgi:hypothetical protein
MTNNKSETISVDIGCAAALLTMYCTMLRVEKQGLEVQFIFSTRDNAEENAELYRSGALLTNAKHILENFEKLTRKARKYKNEL